MNGGGGQDIFKYLSNSDSTYTNMDVIADFSFGASGDKFDLSLIDGAGDVGYSTQVFTSLADLTTYATSNLTSLTDGSDDLELFVGLVNNSSNAAETGAYVLVRSDDMRNWTTSDSISTIVKLNGVGSLSGISADNFIGIADFYNVTTVVIGSAPNTTSLQTLSGGSSGWTGTGTSRTGASGQIFINDKIEGLTEISKQLASSGIEVLSYIAGFGDDIVHANQFEVYYGVYSTSDETFTVTATRAQPPSPSSSYGTSAFKSEFGITHSMVLYDNETAAISQSQFVEGFYLDGFFPETGWTLVASGSNQLLQSGAEVL
jgi:hypothetical protein